MIDVLGFGSSVQSSPLAVILIGVEDDVQFVP
jgi:hypothetical protein